MNTRRRYQFAIATAMCGAVIVTGPTANALAGPATQPASSAVTQQSVSAQSPAGTEAFGTQAAARRQWGPSWISPHYLTTHGKKWVSQTYQSKGNTAGAFLRCYNTNATMRVRILNVDANRYIADSGKKPCNPDASIKVWTKKFQRKDRLRIIVLGNQGSYASAYYK
ncbi:hypothetical protein P9869_39290 [Streptomyces ossamyceticus]|nr:hypothetical protein [Streptomyces ossamyceticus]